MVQRSIIKRVFFASCVLGLYLDADRLRKFIRRSKTVLRRVETRSRHTAIYWVSPDLKITGRMNEICLAH